VNGKGKDAEQGGEGKGRILTLLEGGTGSKGKPRREFDQGREAGLVQKNECAGVAVVGGEASSRST